MVKPHILVMTFAAQGHLNPSLQFSKRLVQLGVDVTFSTSLFAYRRILKTTGIPKGLDFVAFSDGYDDGFKRTKDDSRHFMSELRTRWSKTLKDTFISCAEQGRPVTCLVYTLLLSWAADVAGSFQVPSALLWIQPAFVLDVYYYYFNGYCDTIDKCDEGDPSWSIELPGLPLLKARDLPSFLLPSSATSYSWLVSAFKEQLDTLDAQPNPKILVNTFDALEPEALKAVDKFNLIAVGPLVPSAFLDGKDPLDTSHGGDLFSKSKGYVEWLDSNPDGSVVYVSFGSILVLSKKEREEIARGLLATRRPFLWVVKEKEDSEEEEKLSCMEELEKEGMIVPWCSQLEVLSHRSLGCFVTHCGWNSTFESLVCGAPVVAVPKWADQPANAKLIEDVWRTGVRLKANEEGNFDGEEIRRGIEMVMGSDESGVEMRRNAKKWKELARNAMKEDGSSDKNLKAFVEMVG